jgi:Ca2+-binding EF-hand superfamily protein
MHKFLSILQSAFFAADRDRSGRIDANEIYTALGVANLQTALPAVQAMMRFHDKTGYGVTFQQFLMIAATIGEQLFYCLLSNFMINFSFNDLMI